MSALDVLLSVAVLLAVPAAFRHWRVGPRTLALATIWSLALASTIVLSSLSVCAAALIGPTGAGGGSWSPRHLIPSVPSVGWVSLAVVVAAVVGAFRVLHGAQRRRRNLLGHLRHAEVIRIDGVAVVTLPTEEFLASAVPGPGGCVLMSRGAMRSLSPSELRAVIHHEEAHRRLGHHRHLLLACTLDRSLWFVPGMRAATRALRESLEMVADAGAVEVVDPDSVAGALTRCQAGRDPAVCRRLNCIHARSGSCDRAVCAPGLLAAILLGVSTVAVIFELNWLGFGF